MIPLVAISIFIGILFSGHPLLTLLAAEACAALTWRAGRTV